MFCLYELFHLTIVAGISHRTFLSRPYLIYHGIAHGYRLFRLHTYAVTPGGVDVDQSISYNR